MPALGLPATLQLIGTFNFSCKRPSISSSMVSAFMFRTENRHGMASNRRNKTRGEEYCPREIPPDLDFCLFAWFVCHRRIPNLDIPVSIRRRDAFTVGDKCRTHCRFVNYQGRLPCSQAPQLGGAASFAT